VLIDGQWELGTVIRHPVQDGGLDKYLVKLRVSERQILLESDEDDLLRKPAPGVPGGERLVDHFELIFRTAEVYAAHDEALGQLGQFGANVQLAMCYGPPEVAGRTVVEFSGADGSVPVAGAALDERVMVEGARLLGAQLSDNWREQRAMLVRKNAPVKRKLTYKPPALPPPSAPPTAHYPTDYRFICPVPGCGKAYAASAGLYQHKRSRHPETINKRPSPYDDPRSYACPVPGCDKSYNNAAGLSQHRRIKHPELNINKRWG